MFDFKEAFRIDVSRRTPLVQRLQATKAELSKNSSDTNLSAAEDGNVDDASGVNTPLLSSLTPDSPVVTDTEKVDFLLKLCQALLEYGQCTVDAEERIKNAALAMRLPVPCLSIGPRCMFAAFEGIKSSMLGTKRGIILCKLQDVTELVTHVACHGESYTRQDVEAACVLLEEISKEPLPFGWIVHDIVFVSLCTLAAICAYFGSYNDMLVVFIISLFVLGIKKLAARFPMVLGPLELVLVSAVCGLLTAAAYRVSASETGDKICNIPIIFFSSLVLYLVPVGSELIYGAYEVLMGHFTVGAGRIMSTLVMCMVIALGLTIGWQFTGYNTVKDQSDIPNVVNGTVLEGALASLVPQYMCKPFTEPQNVGPWSLVFGVWYLAMVFVVLCALNVRPRDMPPQFAITYLSMLVYGALNFAGSGGGGLGLNQFLNDVIGLFVATNLSCLGEYVTGVPAIPSIIPVLLLLNPGYSVVLHVLAVMMETQGVQLKGNDPDIVTYLVLLGVSYSLGMYIALSYWKPVLIKRSIDASVLDKAKDVRTENQLFQKML